MKLTELLDQIDRLDQEATKGPWAVWPQMDDDGATYPEYLEGPKNDLFGARGWDGKHYIQEVPELTMDDAEFIALARTALPQLAKALQAVIKTLDDYPLPQKQYDPTGIALAELSTLEQRLREAITDAMKDNDA